MIKKINAILLKFGIQIKKTSAIENERNYFENTIHGLEELIAYRSQIAAHHLNKEITGIVFSKNRAMQLHALLSSYFHYTENPAILKVLFTTGSDEHKASYEILQQAFKNMPVEFIEENDFSMQLKSIVAKLTTDRIFFMTDDAIFLEEYNLADVFNFNPVEDIFSLRLGADFGFSFAYNRAQELPDFKINLINNQQFYNWIWKDMERSPDWSYPLSVDATIFCRDEINIIFRHISFKNPNSLEASLQVFKNVFLARGGACYEKPRYVNIPCNVVQIDFDNIFTGTFDVEALLKLYLDGKRINWKTYEGMNAKEVQHIKFNFI